MIGLTNTEANSLTETLFIHYREMCLVWHDPVLELKPLFLSGLFCYLSRLPNSLFIYAARKGVCHHPQKDTSVLHDSKKQDSLSLQCPVL